jgi:quercetin dioxygenase-like cupin family protein
VLAAALVLLLGVSLQGAGRLQGAAGHPAGHGAAQQTFVNFPGMPTCATAAVQNGDPASGPSIILAKMSAGCAIPWHWHTPNENLMMVSGSARLETKDGQALTLHAGSYARMDSKHVHEFRCSGACSLFIYSDAPFDIHYVDGQGKELSPSEALKAVKETAAEPMK